jgi:glycosyltransferase involved in cell wall biosynthesis
MKNNSEVEVSIIVPAYNEERGLPIVLDELTHLPLSSFEIIVVDDGSTDGTALVAKRFPCRLISHARNQGKGAAMRTGIAASRGRKIIFIDADGSHPASSIPHIVALLDSYDVVVGCRAFERGSIRMLNRLGNLLIWMFLRFLFGVSSRDPLSGLFGIRKEHLLKMELESTGFTIETEIHIKAALMKLRVANLPIPCHPRIGESKLSPFRDGYRILKFTLKHALKARRRQVEQEREIW